ncbi:MAG: hypothetical protein QOH48_1575 [Actinomycetota bacterium]|jgi:hypothetical protein|nr:hypothetical protein [Actinomycetota bacterium]
MRETCALLKKLLVIGVLLGLLSFIENPASFAAGSAALGHFQRRLVGILARASSYSHSTKSEGSLDPVTSNPSSASSSLVANAGP